ncbi:MAG TPA: cohesin domain-containing protein [Anaerolineaceae bacterium]|nr:cohesin domain-containing protein [Anaerolineaceae bacterium]HPA34398.1 cohesin domain-containing protein [Anaerolineaceae bacterium]HQF46744.1 cohesin domain-containing protein [Anaerolineaceae bacterium]HQH36622.1 cohesin domain-containing protein [Anaerolineaceae bacterium]HQJ04630.1 cohesin domain-containing protein [Anaerolineaceae bacterium]
MNNKGNLHRGVPGVLAILLVLSLLLPAPSSPVQAQASAVVAVTPPMLDIIRGSTATYSMWLTGGVDVNAYEVVISYNPALVSSVTYTEGTFLSNLTPVYSCNNNPTLCPGVFHLAEIQITTPGVTGDGNLVDITFTGSANGITPITLTEAVLADPVGETSYPSEVSGVLWIHDDPALTPNFNVTGTVRLQGQTSTGGVPVSLGYGTVHWLGPYSATSTSLPTDNLGFSQVEEDIYRITASSPRYLPVTEASNRTVSISASKTTLSPLLLRGGNAVWQDPMGAPDTVIDALDLTLVSGQYQQTGASLEGDVNFSGRVDIFDFAMVAGNYGLTSITAYAGWTP